MKVKGVECKSALNKSGIGGVDYVINPYVGCAHACVYCYADFMRRFTRHEGDTWGHFVDIKTNIVERLRHEVLGSSGRRAFEPRLPGMLYQAGRYAGEIMLSSVTDPYQPLEARWRLTRGCLEVLLEAESSVAMCTAGRQPRTVSILTKSDLVVRDVDILKGFRDCHVGFTITTARDEVARIFEPGAPPPSRRLAALRVLNGKGIRTWVFMGPVLPFFSDRLDEMDRLFGAVADTGTREILIDCMNFYPSVRNRIGRVFSQFGRSGEYSGAMAYLNRVLKDLEGWKLDVRNNAREAADKHGMQVRFAFF
ncbi:MAG TPA: radical SAM protein [Firmicutes bacterium]|nr:radical SAM protein [Bacillota bacterium]